MSDRHGHSCSDEAHHHHDGSCPHGHDHSDEAELERGDVYSLYQVIDTTRLVCFNEATTGMVKNVFKSYSQKLDTEKYLRSDDDDPELLLVIPFTSPVKLKSICVIGGRNGEAPNLVKLYINKENIDFTSVGDMNPLQQFDLEEDFSGDIDYNTRYAKFQNVTTLVMYFPSNHGADFTTISYIGLKGEYTVYKREAVQAVYELRPQAAKNDPTKTASEMPRQLQ